MVPLYKLSPSDFAYLWNDCKHCYYQKVKFGLAYYGAFPATFGLINTLLQNSIMGMNLRDVNPGFPGGIVEIQEGYMRSKPIPGTNVYLSGRFDILTKLEDGTYGLIDFKITTLDEEKIQKYASQLHAYKFALENPASGAPMVKISKMGIVSISPESVKHKNRQTVFTTVLKWHPIEEDMDGFLKLIKEVSQVLNGKLPPESPTCMLCSYRKRILGQPLSIINIIALGENETVEFKSSFRWDYKLNQTAKTVEHAAIKSIASFLNYNGGTLYIGVDDNGEILGLRKDFNSLSKKSMDGFELYLSQALITALGKESRKYIHVSFEDTERGTICVVKAEPSKGGPVYLKNNNGNKEFYVRLGNASQLYDVEDAVKYIKTQWG